MITVNADFIMTLLVNTAVFSVLFGVMLLVRRLMGNRLSAVLRYALWTVVVIKLLIPFGFESSLSPLNWLPSAPAALVSIEKTGVGNVAPLVVSSGATAQPALTDPAAALSQGQGAMIPSTTQTIAALSAPARWSWQDWSLLIWALGAMAVGLWLGLSLLCARRLVSDSLPIPTRLAKALESCRKELGVRQCIGICLQSSATVPAIMGLFRPTLILPTDVRSADDERLRHILLHELAHYQHGDLAVMQLMNLLNMIYWFNPLIWLCVTQMRADMETICDQRVLRLVSGERQADYVRTVLRYAGAPIGSPMRAALCMGCGRARMERRIRDMLRRRKSDRGARLAAVILAVLLLSTSVLTACQPTPTKPIVVQKDQDKLLQTASPQPASSDGGQTVTPAQSIAEQVGAPQSYRQELKLADGKLTLSADATVWTPEASAMPVVRVAAADFTQQQANGLIQALFGGKKVYEIRRGKLSKEEIDEQILNYKKQKLDPEFKSEGDQAQLDKSIRKLLEARESAPEKADVQTVQSDGMLHLTDSLDQYGNLRYRYMGTSVTNAPNAKKDVAWFTVENNNDLKEAIIDIGDDGLVHGGTPMRRRANLHYQYYAEMDNSVSWDSKVVTPLDGQSDLENADVRQVLHTTPSEALQKAKDFLALAGISDMAVRSIGLITDSTQRDGEEEPGHGHYAYYLQFHRVLAGIPCAYLSGDSGTMNLDESIKETMMDPDKMKFAGFWNYETMEMVLDDSGILKLDWSSPLTVGETLNEQTVLLPYSEIEQRLQEQIKVAYEPQAKKENVDSMRFQIISVRLELQRISEKDSFETGLLVPVWNFYGTITTKYTGSSDDTQPKQGLLVTINAVDGSIIDPSKGY